mmetsp:Transcript_553/g.1826  ORF Transcript_553/g.1826 Transcript_553/m.1826 type:complete len:212 (-) Transcript_553:587-1222(-)
MPDKRLRHVLLDRDAVAHLRLPLDLVATQRDVALLPAQPAGLLATTLAAAHKDPVLLLRDVHHHHEVAEGALLRLATGAILQQPLDAGALQSELQVPPELRGQDAAELARRQLLAALGSARAGHVMHLAGAEPLLNALRDAAGAKEVPSRALRHLVGRLLREAALALKQKTLGLTLLDVCFSRSHLLALQLRRGSPPSHKDHFLPQFLASQ